MVTDPEDHQAFRELVVELLTADGLPPSAASASAEWIAQRLGLERWDVFETLADWDRRDLKPRLRSFDDGKAIFFYLVEEEDQSEQKGERDG